MGQPPHNTASALGQGHRVKYYLFGASTRSFTVPGEGPTIGPSYYRAFSLLEVESAYSIVLAL